MIVTVGFEKITSSTIFSNLAINGDDCPSEPSTRLWKDFKTRAVVFCKFYDVSDAIWYLNNKLLVLNPQALKWVRTVSFLYLYVTLILGSNR